MTQEHVKLLSSWSSRARAVSKTVMNSSHGFSYLWSKNTSHRTRNDDRLQLNFSPNYICHSLWKMKIGPFLLTPELQGSVQLIAFWKSCLLCAGADAEVRLARIFHRNVVHPGYADVAFAKIFASFCAFLSPVCNIFLHGPAAVRAQNTSPPD